MTNDDIEYSVRKKDSANNNNELDISLYVCTCLDFNHDNDIENQQSSSKSVLTESVNSLNILDDNFTGQESSETNNGNIELVKLQGFLATITEEWKGNKGQYI